MKDLETPSNSKKKTNGYSSNVLKQKRQRRQYDADDRLAAWDSLSTQEKLNSLSGRRGESKRQVARLKAQTQPQQQDKKKA
jgi:hypothetical protein